MALTGRRMKERLNTNSDEKTESPPIGQLGILLFQVVVVVLQRFSELPRDSQIIHYCSGACVLASIVAVVWQRARRAPRLFRLSGIGLPLGIAGDSFVVVRMISGVTPLAALVSILVITISVGPWLVSPASQPYGMRVGRDRCRYWKRKLYSN